MAAKSKDEGGALPISNEELARQVAAQQKMLARVATKANFVSFKGGNIIIDGKPIAGAKTDVIVLAFMGERAFFPGDFDPDAPQSPKCYAYFDGDAEAADLHPHEEVREKEAAKCADCPQNKWGSGKRGRGKACRENIRVALIPAQTDLTKAQVFHAKIPITSVPAFKSYASDVLGAGQPLCSVVAQVSCIPDAKTFFKIQWAAKQPVAKQFGAAVMQKAKMAELGISFPYPQFDEEEEVKPVKGKKARK